MFSGIIRYRGLVILSLACPELVEGSKDGGAQLTVRCEGAESERPQRGDSIAVDGICLTATAVDGDVVGFDVVPETLARSTLGDRVAGDLVNVEYALRVGDRLGGHFVYGHVDSAATVLSRTPEGQGERMRVESPPALAPMIPPKRSSQLTALALPLPAPATAGSR